MGRVRVGEVVRVRDRIALARGAARGELPYPAKRTVVTLGVSFSAVSVLSM